MHLKNVVPNSDLRKIALLSLNRKEKCYIEKNIVFKIYYISCFMKNSI